MTELKTDEAESALAEHLAAVRTLGQPAPAAVPGRPGLAGDAADDPRLAALREVSLIGGWLADDATRHLFEQDRWLIAGEEYELASEDQMRALGEDSGDPFQPLILRRKRDGKFFEIDVDVAVAETSVEIRSKQREQFRRSAKAAGA